MIDKLIKTLKGIAAEPQTEELPRIAPPETPPPEIDEKGQTDAALVEIYRARIERLIEERERSAKFARLRHQQWSELYDNEQRRREAINRILRDLREALFTE